MNDRNLLFERGRRELKVIAGGVSRTMFLMKLVDCGVDSFKLSEEELQRESRLA